MFDQFPKTRPPLSRDIEALYLAYYKSNRGGQTTASSLAQRMESWLHKQVAKDVVNPANLKNVTLELGAGTLNHLQYEPNFHPYDIVEPFTELYKNSPCLERVRNVYSDIADVPDSSRYDRITSVATLEHICNLPEVVARSGLLLAENGVFRASIPSEGTFLWTLGWKMTTGLEFKLKHGIDYNLIMKFEHVNTAREIEEVLKYFFGEIRCKVFGITKSCSLYRYYECNSPFIARCYKYLSEEAL